MKSPSICHPEKPLHGRGMCAACYVRQLRANNESSRISHRKANSRWRKANRPARKYIELKWLYGLTKEQFNAMLEKQNNACAICEKSWSKRGPCVDHDHNTKIVRGLLCDDCNKKLGHYEKLLTYPKFGQYLAKQCL